MKLYIDTSDAEKIIIKLDDEQFETASRQNKSQMLLPFIVEKLSEKGKSLHDITEVSANPGPGSFTGLRVGISVANAISWTLKIPKQTQPTY